MDAHEPSRSDAGSEGRHQSADGSIERYVVVYAAANLAEAYHVKNILAEEGITAEVTNSLLEGGSGVDIVGWPTLPRLLVRESDAGRARLIALDYDRTNRLHRGEIEVESALEEIGATGSPESQSAASDDARRDATIAATNAVAATTRGRRSRAGNELPAWPCCPECGRKRIAQCPYCGACGSDFALGEPPPDPMADESAEADPGRQRGENPAPGGIDIFAPAQTAAGPCCGPGGCGAATEPPVAAPLSSDCVSGPHDEPAELLVICPQCDEPFVPQFTRQCEWCNRQFADGRPPQTFAGEVLNPAAVWLIFGLIGLLGALFAWFAWLL